MRNPSIYITNKNRGKSFIIICNKKSLTYDLACWARLCLDFDAVHRKLLLEQICRAKEYHIRSEFWHATAWSQKRVKRTLFYTPFALFPKSLNKVAVLLFFSDICASGERKAKDGRCETNKASNSRVWKKLIAAQYRLTFQKIYGWSKKRNKCNWQETNVEGDHRKLKRRNRKQ